MVSGFVFKQFGYGMENLSPAAYPLATDIRAIGRVFSTPRPFVRSASATHTGHRRAIDRNGFCRRRRHVADSSVAIRFAIDPSLLCQEIHIVPSNDGELELVPTIATEGVPGQVFRDRAPDRTEIDMVMGLESHGGLSRLGEAISILTPDGLLRKGDPFTRPDGVTRSYFLAGKAGQPVRFQTVAALASQLYHAEPDLEAIRLARWGSSLGFDQLRSENRRVWSDLWKSRVRISGDTDDQRMLDAAFFYLHSSVHPSNQTGMAPFGLSQFAYYFGHSFWDTESWSFLPVVLTSPEAARALLEYRLRSLPPFRRLADLFGYRGAQFPWEAGRD